MKPKKLQAADRPIIASLNRSTVEAALLALKPFLAKSRWIGKTNRYRQRAAERVTKDYARSTLKGRNLSQYIAASVSLHASDGWSYLGRSINAILTGDPHRALHLAYYAELRAAMSLLAGAGVGIFNTRHVTITGANNITKLATREGTHIAAWLALEEWAQGPQSGVLLANLISTEGLCLQDWFAPLGGAARLAPQAKSWFMQWGMDLRFAVKDRTARNESSYRPDGLPQTATASPFETLSFVRDLWAALEPRGSSSFEQLDRHILRIALEKHYLGTTGKQPQADALAFGAFISSILAAQNLPAKATQLLQGFLLRQVVPADPAIFHYSALRPSDVNPLPVLSRAVFLLRIATGSGRDLLTSAGIDSAALSFWWRALGEGRGLWEPSAEPSDLTDLWADIRDYLTAVDPVGPNDPEVASFASLARSFDHYAHASCGYERVGLWGICPS